MTGAHGRLNKQKKHSKQKHTTSPKRAAKAAAAEPADDPIALLSRDHRTVEELFARYPKAEDKAEVARRICLELIVHTGIEEEVFYPACREHLPAEQMSEAQVEHDTAKTLIAELLAGDPGDRFYDAKVKVLSEYIKHHVAEEEKKHGGIFAKARAAGLNVAELAKQLQLRGSELRVALERRMEAPAALTLFSKPNQTEGEGIMPRNNNMRERDEHGRFMSDEPNRDYDREGRRGTSRGRDDAYERDERYAPATHGRDEYGRFTGDEYDDRYQPRSRGNYDEGDRSRREWNDRYSMMPPRDEHGRFVSDDSHHLDQDHGQRSRGWYAPPDYQDEGRRAREEREGFRMRGRDGGYGRGDQGWSGGWNDNQSRDRQWSDGRDWNDGRGWSVSRDNDRGREDNRGRGEGRGNGGGRAPRLA